MKKYQKIISLIVSLGFLLLSLTPSPLWAWSDPSQPAVFSDFEEIFRRVTRIVLSLAGLAVLIVLISGGFKYLTAGDDPKKAEGASKTLTGAVTGLIVILGAWIILRAIGLITGFDVTTFRIPQ